MSPILTSIVLGLTAAAANVFGGAVIVQRTWERRYLRYFVALGAGFMLATAMVEMVPESLALAGRKGALLILAGYLIVHLFEHTITPHFHYGEETHADEFVDSHKRMSVLVGLMIPLYTAMRSPGNYGFIPHTLSNDGDPCDVLVANTRAIVPGAVMSVRPVGVLLMEDEAGGDEKIIAVPSSKLTQRYDKVKSYGDLPDITLHQIQHFFEHYKDLEPNKWVKVIRWGGAEDAHRLIEEGIARAGKK